MRHEQVRRKGHDMPQRVCSVPPPFLMPPASPPLLAPRSVTELLERRRQQQAKYDAGDKPCFLPETKKVGGRVRGRAGLYLLTCVRGEAQAPPAGCAEFTEQAGGRP